MRFFRADKPAKCSLMLLGKSPFECRSCCSSRYPQQIIQESLTSFSWSSELFFYYYYYSSQSTDNSSNSVRNPLYCTSEITITIATNWHFCWQSQEKQAASDGMCHGERTRLPACQNPLTRAGLKHIPVAEGFFANQTTQTIPSPLHLRCTCSYRGITTRESGDQKRFRNPQNPGTADKTCFEESLLKPAGAGCLCLVL